jgi:hypothetical protein
MVSHQTSGNILDYSQNKTFIHDCIHSLIKGNTQHKTHKHPSVLNLLYDNNHSKQVTSVFVPMNNLLYVDLLSNTFMLYKHYLARI